ncbi:hypothetical protein BDV97DRAFT_7857 [Delphinella strobiligena]|nr:hypothetical protein BDV97DRAFT_7857 [Delphinella strobiligena]
MHPPSPPIRILDQHNLDSAPSLPNPDPQTRPLHMSKRTLDHAPAVRRSESHNPRRQYVLPRVSHPAFTFAFSSRPTHDNPHQHNLPEQETHRAFAHQPTGTVHETLRLSSTDLHIPRCNDRAWDLCQVVISSRPVVSVSVSAESSRMIAPTTTTAERLLVGEFATGAFRAYQSVLRLLSLLPDGLLPDGVGIDGEASVGGKAGKGGEARKGRRVLGPRDFAVHAGGEEVCTICARTVLRVPRNLSVSGFVGWVWMSLFLFRCWKCFGY